MFEDSLFASKTQHYSRGWTAFVSLTIQTFFVGTLIAVPMLFPDALPFRALKKIVDTHRHRDGPERNHAKHSAPAPR